MNRREHVQFIDRALAILDRGSVLFIRRGSSQTSTNERIGRILSEHDYDTLCTLLTALRASPPREQPAHTRVLRKQKRHVKRSRGR
jgi:hypothetical protein